MKIKRTSAITGTVRIVDIPVDPNDLLSWEQGAVNIQDAMPYLSDNDREFILTGITSDEWDTAFADTES